MRFRYVTATGRAVLCVVPLLVVLLVGGIGAAGLGQRSVRPTIAVWQTSPDGDRLTRLPDLTFSDASAVSPGPTLVVDAGRRYQKIVGFGGAFNERGWLALQSLSAGQRRDILLALFDDSTGAGYSLVRTPIGASDYALNAYSLDETPGDVSMRDFSIDRDRTLLIPYIQAAREIAPSLTVWASPWSAPAWMKTNNSMTHGGSLIAAYEPAYARYLAAYVQAYAASGIPIRAISVQNEPTQGPAYPSMVMPASQMAEFVGNYLAPLFSTLGLHTAIRVNEEPTRARWDYTLQVIANPAVRKAVAGSDLHGYHGSSADLLRLHNAAPGLDIWQSEAMNLDRPHYEYADAPRWGAEIAEDLQNWVSGWDFWNMVTDDTGRSSWGWQQDAVVLVNTDNQGVAYTPKYYAMAHFSRFIRPGAYRIATSGVPRGLVATAARNPDGTDVLVVVNSGRGDSTFTLATGGMHARVTVPGQGIVTLDWH
jgi:O-glycosyl hydrolase